MTMIHPSLKAMLKQAEQRDSYWVEKAKLDFAIELNERCRAAGISNAQLARKLNTSASYITKIFRGDTNFTIETMVKLARAAGAAIDFHLVDESARSVLAPETAPASIVILAGQNAKTGSSAKNRVLAQEGLDQDQWPPQNYIAKGVFSDEFACA